MITLRDYQEDALAALAAAEGKGQRRSMIVLPTGSGKTVVFGGLTSRTKGRVLILAHREELLDQAYRRMREVDDTLEIGIVKAERDNIGARVVLASVQTLAGERRRERLFAGHPFERVIVDEGHHLAAQSYRDIITQAGCFEPDGPRMLAVTATPNRGDGVGLSEVIQGIVFERDILWGIRAGHLCDLIGKQVYMAVDFDRVRTTAGDFQDGALGEAMEDAGAPEVIAAAYLEHAAGRRTIVFTPTVRIAELTAAALVAVGVTAELVSGTTPAQERRDVLSRFHSGATAVLCNCAIATEGFDEPEVNCIIIARPTKSGAFWTQMVGRGTRRFVGKDNCLVLDMIGNTNRHSLVTLSSLFGLPLSALKQGKASVTEALDEQEAEAERRAVARGQVKTREVDLFGRRTKLHWIADGVRWLLPAGDRQFMLVPTGGDYWQLWVQPRNGGRVLIMPHTSLGLAMGTAEDAVRELGTTVLAAKDARWRNDPPSDKQLELLQRKGIAVTDALTKGAASDLLSLAFAGKR